MLRLLLQVPSSVNGWMLWLQTWGPYLLLLSFLGLCAFVVKWYMSQDPVRTVNVLGYDPRIPWWDIRECEVQGEYAIWEEPEGENIRFPVAQETQHSTGDGPGWILDLTDGRTMRINESTETIRTTGQEFDMAVKDETIRQSLSTKQDDIAMYMKLGLIAAPIIILLLIVVAIGVFTG